MTVPIFTKCLNPHGLVHVNRLCETYADKTIPRGPGIRAGNSPRNVARTRNRLPKVKLKIDG